MLSSSSFLTLKLALMRKEWNLETSNGDSWADKNEALGQLSHKLIPTVLRIYPPHLLVPPGKSRHSIPIRGVCSLLWQMMAYTKILLFWPVRTWGVKFEASHPRHRLGASWWGEIWSLQGRILQCSHSGMTIDLLQTQWSPSLSGLKNTLEAKDTPQAS